jgi:hypothetical protein
LFSKKKKKEETPVIYTVEKCQSCGQKKRRRFQDNDYVYKGGLNCKNCSGSVMITAIYGEYPPEKQQKQK